jgi:hypothetical protein
LLKILECELHQPFHLLNFFLLPALSCV